MRLLVVIIFKDIIAEAQFSCILNVSTRRNWSMKRHLLLVCAIAIALFGLSAQQTQAAGGETYTVQPGDTLSTIAAGYGIPVNELAIANGLYWNAWVYTGQQLVIPIQETAPITQFDNQPSQFPQSDGIIETVQPGDTLSSIAARYGVNVNELAAANGLPWNAWLYTGQQLIIPTAAYPPIYNRPAVPASPGLDETIRDTVPIYNRPAVPAPLAQPMPSTEPNYSPPPQTAPNVAPTTSGEKWIDIDLTAQTVTAYEGETPVFNALVSTGTSQYQTVVGVYKVYVKHKKTRMRGGYGVEAYDLPDVPYVMYFYRGYGLHGTYWHNNFGTPMSHGCVNLSTTDAEWLFNWASVGTRVVTHY